MSKPYDATLKAMLEASPADWSQLAGLQASRVEIIDADLSTITAATDKALRLHGPDAILAFDFQAGPDPSLSQRVHCYNTLLRQRDGLPVRSVVVLLRPGAKLNSINGIYEERFLEEEQPYLTFRYQIVRVWELSAERLLAGGLGTLPLAPISAVTEADLPGIIEQLKEKFGKLEQSELAGQLWTEIDVLMGLRYERELVGRLLQGVQGMEESVTYQAIVEKGEARGRLKEARRNLLRWGERVYHQPATAQVRAVVEAISDIERLEEELSDRILSVKNWEEFLADLQTSAAKVEKTREEE